MRLEEVRRKKGKDETGGDEEEEVRRMGREGRDRRR